MRIKTLCGPLKVSFGAPATDYSVLEEILHQDTAHQASDDEDTSIIIGVNGRVKKELRPL